MSNPKTHEENRDVLIVIIRSAVRCAIRASFTRRAAVHEPVGFGNNEQVTTAARKIPIGNRGLKWTLGSGTILHLLRPKNPPHTRPGQAGLPRGFSAPHMSNPPPH